MRKLLLTVTTLMVAVGAKAQVESHVKWSFAAKKVNATEAIVLIKATIDKGWHIYSQNPKSGGLKTSFTFKKSPYYVLAGKTIEPAPVVKFESAINKNVEYFENSVVFQQKIKLRSAKATTVDGKLEFLACSTKCLPPDEVAFAIPIGK